MPVRDERERHGLVAYPEDRVRFIHATTTEYEFDLNTVLQPIGYGEFGIGFYTFIYSGVWMDLARRRALEWGRTKRQGTDRPLLVVASMPVQQFLDLPKLEVTEANLDLYWKGLDPNRLTNQPLVFGPVGKSGPTGRILLWDQHQPLQYKFEEKGLRLLQIESVTPLG